ncbi:transposase family protein [Streptomyces europaeiscabiei]|nr:transposase family protein [Streptomyces europaeiscabiei]WSG29044.1 transposase family protein [Streptomyces europaeiscabiei]
MGPRCSGAGSVWPGRPSCGGRAWCAPAAGTRCPRSAATRNGELAPTQRTVNRALSAARAPVERSVARLKSWRIFRRARCSPNRLSSIAANVLTLERQR